MTRPSLHRARLEPWSSGELKAQLCDVVDGLAGHRGRDVSPLDVALELLGGEPGAEGSIIYCVEKQPLFGSPPSPICGIWETLDVFASEASAQDYCRRTQEAYGGQPVVVRLAKRTVHP